MGVSLMKYANGHRISKNVIEAIRFVAKVGALSRKSWYEQFSHGTQRWRRMQFQYLIDQKIFKHHTSKFGHDAVVIGSLGLELINNMKWQRIPSIYPHMIEHDEVVGIGLWKLEKAEICKKWMTENEMKNENSASFRLEVKQGGFKYPDAVFKLQGNLSAPIVALEYERTAKTNHRYIKAIRSYSEAYDFAYIFFIVENDAIEKAIQRAMNYIGDGRLNSRIGFVKIENWETNPLSANLQGINLGQNLKELVKKI
jgi:hypothetical protein